MKKLILLVLSVMAALSINASQITHEQLVQINKFNKGWTNIVAVQNKGVSMKIQQHNTLRTCRTVFNENHKVTVTHYKLSCQDLFDKIKKKKVKK
jgi:hypothetical protein